MKITKPKSFIINRKKWYRGKDSGSMLRRPDDGKKCCLGFYANACGVPSQQITSRYGPEDLPAPLPGVSRLVREETTENTYIGWEMMKVNDSDDIPEQVRESKLRTLFNRIKVKVKFIN